MTPARDALQPALLVFAIRRKGTQEYLCELTRGGRGYSWEEPQPVGPGHRLLPRIFHSRTAAKQALLAWLKGHHVKRYRTEYGSDETEQWIEVVPVAHRKGTEMEIIGLTMRPAGELQQELPLGS